MTIDLIGGGANPGSVEPLGRFAAGDCTLYLRDEVLEDASREKHSGGELFSRVAAYSICEEVFHLPKGSNEEWPRLMIGVRDEELSNRGTIGQFHDWRFGECRSNATGFSGVN
jgi:hypothetical protein